MKRMKISNPKKGKWIKAKAVKFNSNGSVSLKVSRSSIEREHSSSIEEAARRIRRRKNPSKTEPYTGPFPRGKHSHTCRSCKRTRGQGAYACYKANCTKPQSMVNCEICRQQYGN